MASYYAHYLGPCNSYIKIKKEKKQWKALETLFRHCAVRFHLRLTV